MMILKTATGKVFECLAHFCPPIGNVHLILNMTKAQAAELFEDPDETERLMVIDGETILAELDGYTQLHVISAVEPGEKNKTRVSISKP